MEKEAGGRAVARVVDTQRRTLGLTSAEVARRAHVSPNTLGNWRNGKGISDATLSQVAEVLELSLPALWDAYAGRCAPEPAMDTTPGAVEPLQAVLARQTKAIEALDDRLAAVVRGQEFLAKLLRAALAARGAKR